MNEASPTFQTQVLGLLAQDKKLLRQHRFSFSPSFFTNVECANVSKLMLDFYDEYRGRPSEDTLRSLVDEMLSEDETLSQQAPAYENVLDRMYRKLRPQDKEYIKTNLEQLIRKRLVTQALMKTAELHGQGQYDKMVTTLQKATTFSFNSTDTVLEWEEGNHYDYLDRPEIEGIPTGFDDLDAAMHGGIRPTELGFIVGTTGVGKSMTMMNMARGALEQDKKVLYVTLENSDTDSLQRMDAIVGNVPYWMLKEKITYFEGKRKIKKWKLRHPEAKFHVKFFPTASVTVPEIGNFIIGLQQIKQIRYDIVFIDYGDIIKPTQVYTSRYDELGSTYTEMKTLAQTLKIPIWTASQGNRQALTARVVQMHHLAESVKKAFGADMIMTLSQDDSEKKQGIFRGNTVKMRSHESGQEFWFQAQYDKCIITQIDHARYDFLRTQQVDMDEQIDKGISATKSDINIDRNLKRLREKNKAA